MAVVSRTLSYPLGLAGSLALALCFAALPLSCSGDKPPNASAGSGGKPQSGLRAATIRSGSVELIAELAISQDEQTTGLMHRTELPDGRGMLFVYPDDRRMSFWMKNTLVPLSIAFIGADGAIKEIHDMEPLSLAAVESERYARYALEVPKGWFGRAGLKPGDKFDLSAVKASR